ncbi:MAG: hypothetical protein BWY83_01926 [bacterium ADurb.Bin478]|nr:MAG: hypothetical protein BWY83_01926 [bacterium ADurb.Bin478]
MNGVPLHFVGFAASFAQCDVAVGGKAVAGAGQGILGEKTAAVLLLGDPSQLLIQFIEHADFINDVLIAAAGQKDASLFRDVHDMALLIDGVIELAVDLAHLFVDLVFALQLFDQLFDPELGGQQFEQLGVFRIAAVYAHQGYSGCGFILVQQLFAAAEQFFHQLLLLAV